MKKSNSWTREDMMCFSTHFVLYMSGLKETWEVNLTKV
jgi:hypothetical protein